MPKCAEHHKGLYSYHFFSLYTKFALYVKSPVIFRKSADSGVVRCIRDGHEAEDRELADLFVAWCGNNHLILDANKTRF